jgi:hypothetical protein
MLAYCSALAVMCKLELAQMPLGLFVAYKTYAPSKMAHFRQAESGSGRLARQATVLDAVWRISRLAQPPAPVRLVF